MQVHSYVCAIAMHCIVYYIIISLLKIAKKLCNQITKETKSLKALLYKYNAFDEVPNITLAEAQDPLRIEERLRDFGCWHSSVLATGKKRQIIDAYLSLCRSNEELFMLEEEAASMTTYYEKRKISIIAVMTRLSSEINPYS